MLKDNKGNTILQAGEAGYTKVVKNPPPRPKQTALERLKSKLR